MAIGNSNMVSGLKVNGEQLNAKVVVDALNSGDFGSLTLGDMDTTPQVQPFNGTNPCIALQSGDIGDIIKVSYGGETEKSSISEYDISKSNLTSLSSYFAPTNNRPYYTKLYARLINGNNITAFSNCVTSQPNITELFLELIDFVKVTTTNLVDTASKANIEKLYISFINSPLLTSETNINYLNKVKEITFKTDDDVIFNNMSSSFRFCPLLEKLDMSTLTFASNCNMENAFMSVPMLTKVYVKNQEMKTICETNAINRDAQIEFVVK